jgi:hypothetical protein
MPNEQDETEEKTPDSQEYDEAIARIPATYVDTFTINWWRGNLRITFGEFLYGKKHYRSAIVIPFSDAEVLAAYIRDILKNNQEDKKTE